MKYSVYDFKRNDDIMNATFRQPITPAVECILIAQSKHAVNEKIEALEERLAVYTDADFQTEDYHINSDLSFRELLGKYMETLHTIEEMRHTRGDGISYTWESDDEDDLTSVEFPSFEEAVRYFDICSYIRRHQQNQETHDICWELLWDGSVDIYDIGLENYKYDFAGLCKIVNKAERKKHMRWEDFLLMPRTVLTEDDVRCTNRHRIPSEGINTEYKLYALKKTAGGVVQFPSSYKGNPIRQLSLDNYNDSRSQQIEGLILPENTTSLQLSDFPNLRWIWIPKQIKVEYSDFENNPKLETVFYEGTVAEWDRLLTKYYTDAYCYNSEGDAFCSRRTYHPHVIPVMQSTVYFECSREVFRNV